jgi:hypothetical protein
MIRVQCLSLIDVSTVTSEQKSNFNTLKQTIELRSQINIVGGPKKMQNQDMSLYKFGSDHSDSHSDSTRKFQTVWKIEFEYEQELMFGKNFESLLEDLNDIPIIHELEDTAIFKQSTFVTQDSEQKNIYFKQI